MTIRLKILLACFLVLMTIIGLGLFSRQQLTEMSDLGKNIYDRAFMGVNYARKSQIDWILIKLSAFTHGMYYHCFHEMGCLLGGWPFPVRGRFDTQICRMFDLPVGLCRRRRHDPGSSCDQPAKQPQLQNFRSSYSRNFYAVGKRVVRRVQFASMRSPKLVCV